MLTWSKNTSLTADGAYDDGRLVVFKMKDLTDSANSSTLQVVGTFISLANNLSLTWDSEANRLYFNSEGEGQLFTLIEHPGNSSQIDICFYGTSNYIATTGYEMCSFNKNQAWVFVEMIEK